MRRTTCDIHRSVGSTPLPLREGQGEGRVSSLQVAPFFLLAQPSPNRSLRGRGVRHAFTLIEVILAISLSVLLIGTALWFHKYAADVRNAVSLESSDIAARRQIMDRITSDLRGTIALPGQAGALDGSTDRISFITAALPGKSVWVEQKLTETPPPAEQDLRQVSYGLAIFEDTQGARFIAGIDGSVQKILSPKVLEEGSSDAAVASGSTSAQVSSSLLSSKYQFMRFQFWDGTAWQIEWKEKPTPPVAVEVVIGVQPLEEGQDPLAYSHEIIRRVVFLPSGSPSPQEGGAIQGLTTGGVP